LSEDLLDHLKPTDKRHLTRLKYENVPWSHECQFVDRCVQVRIEKGTLLEWNSIPEFVPRRIVRALKRATATKNRLNDASEFLAQLASPKPLPNWIRGNRRNWTLRGWKGSDYQLTEHDGKISVMKRRMGSAKFMNDNALSGGTWEETLARLSQKLELP
jgi:hypothetical protein